MAIYCKAEKGHNAVRFAENTGVIDEWKHSWPKGEISYRLNNWSTDNISEYHQNMAVTVALRAWQLYISDLKFRRERNPDVSVDFDVFFKGRAAFSSNNVFAHAYYPGQGKVSGDVEINDGSWEWVTDSRLQDLARPPLVPILIHEFGHSLGLSHDPRTPNAIMYPYFDLGKKKNHLHAYDIERMQSRYGERKLSQRLLDYFAARRDNGWDFD